MDETGMFVATGERTGGGRPSEDRVVRTPHAIAVLDGVSTLATTTPLGGWYADCLGMELAAGLTQAPDADLREILEGAIGAVHGARRGLVPGESPPPPSPSRACATTRWRRWCRPALPSSRYSVTEAWMSCATTGSPT
ncbi:hypothetical protein ACFV94_34630 [Streptomyces sp. NPDC059896]|uniref:hypothetical protein n=1 Tax=Streptomyces sp. NPDC059896 TaxID=3346993 RepID=UPI0036489032